MCVWGCVGEGEGREREREREREKERERGREGERAMKQFSLWCISHFSDVEVSFAQAAYEFAEDASDAVVCVVLSSSAERSVSVLLNTANQTALSKYSMKRYTFFISQAKSSYFQHRI